ncbi:MAG TPA: TPM domain-containing protein, partial [Gemmatimonadaceae bacterium]|nr:TPM domain-containing protein [Gemmatimonadaceae bacterium]
MKLPEPRGYINDFANVIPAEQQQHIQAIIDDVRAKSGGEIVVVTLPDLGTAAPSDVALQIGRTWKVGKLGKPGDPTRNTGVIILLQPKETASSGRGQCYIGVGYGSEGFITDATSGQICRDATDYFRARDYGSGIAQVTLQVAQRFADEYHFALDTTLAASTPAPEPVGRGGGRPLSLAQIAFIIFIIVFLLSRVSRGRGCGGCIPIFLPIGGGRGGGWSSGG